MNGFVQEKLGDLAVAAARRPWRFVAASAAAAALAAVSFLALDLDDDITSLFPSGDREVAALKALHGSAGGTDFALVILHAPEGNRVLLKRASDELAARLMRGGESASVHWRISEDEKKFYVDTFMSRAFLFLPEKDLEAAAARLSPEGIDAMVARCERLLESPIPKVEEQVVRDPLNLFEDFFAPYLKRRSMGTAMDLETGHMLSRDGTALMMRVYGRKSPRDAGYSKVFMASLGSAVAETLSAPEFAAAPVRADVTGGYPAALRNERSVKRNLSVSFAGAFAGLLLLFMAGYRSLRVNVTVGVPLAVGTACAFGASAPALGFHMTALSAAFGSILAGLGIDFPIHIYHRFRDSVSAGRSFEDGLKEALRETGPGVISAGLTTALAFGLLCVADFRGMVEVGAFVGLGIMAMMLVMLTLLPAMIAIVDGDRWRCKPVGAGFGIARLEAFFAATGPLGVIAGLAVFAASAALLAASGPPAFERDLRKMQPPDEGIERANSLCLERFGISLNPILVISKAPGREEALSIAADAEDSLEPMFADGTLMSVAGPGGFIPGAARIERNRRLLDGIDPDRVAAEMNSALERRGFDPEPFSEGIGRLAESIRGSRGGATGSKAPPDDLLKPFLAREGSDHLAVTTVYVPCTAGPGAHAAAAERAAKMLEGKLGDGGVVTSMDMLVDRMRKKVVFELEEITGLVALAIVVVVAVHFRSILPSVIALLPVVSGFAITLAAMSALGMNLNFMNVVVFPMLLGIGVDDGIHFVHRWRSEKGERWRAALHGAGLPIVMTSLTSILGFGSLVLTDNPGLRSVGYTASIGIGACLASTLLILPPLCRLLERMTRVSS